MVLDGNRGTEPPNLELGVSVSGLVTGFSGIKFFFAYDLAAEITTRVLARSSCSKFLFSGHIIKHHKLTIPPRLMFIQILLLLVYSFRVSNLTRKSDFIFGCVVLM